MALLTPKVISAVQNHPIYDHWLQQWQEALTEPQDPNLGSLTLEHKHLIILLNFTFLIEIQVNSGEEKVIQVYVV